MGKAQVKANKDDIKNTIQSWSARQSISTSNKSNSIKGKNNLCQITWNNQETSDGQLVEVTVQPRKYIIIALDAFLIITLFWVILKIQDLIRIFNVTDLLQLIVLALSTMLAIRLKSNFLWFKLTQIENSFWQDIQKTFDTKIISRSDAKLQSHKYWIFTESALTIELVYICSLFIGIFGFIVSMVVALLIIIMGTVDTMTSQSYQCNWRFWMIRNQFKWTVYLLSTFAFVLVLTAIELIVPTVTYNRNDTPSLIHIIREAHFRKVVPENTEVLEKDTQDILAKLSESLASKSNKPTKDIKKASEKHRYAWCVAMLIVVIIGVCFFSIRPFKTILQSPKIWRHEMVWQNTNVEQAPFVPSQINTWQWTSQPLFQATVYLYYVIAGIIHIATNMFCFESLSYVMFSKCLVFTSIANLWSWVFVICKIVFGQNIGQGFAVTLVIVVSLPVLLLVSVFLRRLWSTVRFIIRVFWNRYFTTRNATLPHPVQEDLKVICKQNDLKEPLILISRGQRKIPIRLWHIPLIGHSVIEINNALLDLLIDEELKAAVAHELGHLHSGQIKITLMKWFSSLALFPNYYLAICINWAQLEMEADQFAIEATKNPSALKHALVKISTIHISYRSVTDKRETRRLQKLRDVKTAFRYYFGDGLLSYAHPSLTERLTVIDKTEIK